MLRLLSKSALTFALLLGATSLSAQNLRDTSGPAELPPSNFTGKQYVDSNGCVFVRAGFDGAVTWVPRVSRNRQVICGFQPTFAAAAPEPTPQPEPEPTIVATPTVTPEVEAPVVVAAPEPEPTPEPTVVIATPRVTTQPAPVATPRVRVATPAPRRVVAAPTPAPAPMPAAKPAAVATAPVVAESSSSCPKYTGISAKYGGTKGVRCGPQAVHPGKYAPGYDFPAHGTPGKPNQMAGHIVKPAPEIAIPPGYKSAFDDDRFNPHRGKQTREGFYQMRLVWTAGVPRRLVDQNTGKDVTGLFPGLKFPFISQKTQDEYVARHGWPTDPAVAPAAKNVVVSTKNSPEPLSAKPTAVPAPAANGHRFVQIGMFSHTSKADKAVRRLQQMGLPVKIADVTRKGIPYRIVVAGPFGSASSLQNGLNAVHRAGYTNARTRK